MPAFSDIKLCIFSYKVSVIYNYLILCANQINTLDVIKVLWELGGNTENYREVKDML